MHKIIKKIPAILIYVLFVIMMILTISSKQNLHIDEYLSYGLANSYTDHAVVVDWGVPYKSDAIERVFLNFLSASKSSSFNYAGV